MALVKRTTATAIAHGRHRFWFLLTTALVVFVPLGLLEAVNHGIEINTDEGVHLLDLVEATAVAVTALLGEVFYAGTIASVVSRGPEYEPRAGELLRRIPFLTIIAIDLIVAFASAFGFLLLILPGLWIYGSWILGATIADIDHVGVREALRRSARLAKGHRVAIVTTLLSVTIASELLAELLQALIENFETDDFLVDWTSATLSSAVVAPFFGLMCAAFVIELRALKGGQPEPADAA
jgi:hypothetical protein